MREINIKQLKNNLSKELKDLPFIITLRGEVVATCSKVATSDSKVATSKVATNRVATSDDKVATPNINTPQDVKDWHKSKVKGKHITYFKSAHSK